MRGGAARPSFCPRLWYPEVATRFTAMLVEARGRDDDSPLGGEGYSPPRGNPAFDQFLRPPGARMSEETLDLRATLRALRRQRTVFVSLLALGIGVGLVWTLAERRTFAANARVLLPAAPGVDNGGRPIRNIDTEIHVARSAEILNQAGKALRKPVDAAALRRRLKVRAATADLLEFRAKAGSAPDAVRLANEVAHAYVSYANTVSSTQVESTITELERHSADLVAETRKLEERIAGANSRLRELSPASPEALSLGALLSTLSSNQLDTERRLYSVNSHIGEIRLNARLSRGGARLLDPAIRSRQIAPRPFWNTLIGGSIGLLAGVVSALWRAQRNPRLYRQVDIADAVRVPILASLEAPRTRGAREYRELLEGWEPNALEKLALHDAYGLLGLSSTPPHANLVVLTLAGDHQAHFVAVKLAAFSATAGVDTAFVVGPSDSSVASLRLACGVGSESEPPRPNLRVYGFSDVGDIELNNFALTVILASGPPGYHLPPMGGRRTVVTLAVSAGIATAEMLAAVAASSLNAGHPVRGVFLANPERGDRGVTAPDAPASVPLGSSDMTSRGEDMSASAAGEAR